MLNDLKRDINFDKSKNFVVRIIVTKHLSTLKISDFMMLCTLNVTWITVEWMVWWKNNIKTCVWKNFLGEIGQPHWVNSSMVEQTIRGDRIQNFANVSYTMIHGMNDDNVHFKTSADMQKLLSKNDIEFDAIVSDIN